MDMFNLTGKVAIITGGGSGLGLQMATALAEAGADIVLASRRLEVCEKEADNLSKLGVKTLAVEMDVTSPQDVGQMVESAISKFGKIDILVNNSGIGKVTPTLETTIEEWTQVMNVNVTGTFLCCRMAGKYMTSQKSGKIINIASIYGSVGVDQFIYTGSKDGVFEELSYPTSKGALLNFTRDLAIQWARFNINVNSISPGGFIIDEARRAAAAVRFGNEFEKRWCDRTPLGRVGNEEDLKGAVVYLASSASNYVTGHNLVVDGGWLAW